MANNLWEDKEIHLDSGDKGFMYVLIYCNTKSFSKCLTIFFLFYSALCAIILIGIFLGTLMEVWFIFQGKMSNNVEPPSSKVHTSFFILVHIL